jgi:hypothetical protein
MTLYEIAGVLVAVFAGWFVWDSLKVREIANAAMRTACAREGWLFLDDTVALESLWLARDDQGHVRLRRTYAFEYSDTGRDRRKGSITLVAERVLMLRIESQPMPEGRTLH